ncbi:MAG: TldD/PmbA family protein, partial [Methanomicrobiales archaeon]|nr:TldD/PmbA family protein [Methanomicrobiales archaeon]
VEGAKRAEEVEIYSVGGTALSLSLKSGVIDTAITTRSWGLGIRTIQEGRIGFSSTSDPMRWQECLEAAIASGKVATSQEWKGLPPSENLHVRALRADPAVSPDLEIATTLMEGLLAGANTHPQVRITGGEIDLFRGEVRLWNSHGIAYYTPSTRVSVSLETILGESTGYEFDSSAFLDVDAEKVGEKAAFLAAHSATGGDIDTGAYEIILSPIASAQLIGQVVIPALSGRNVHAGRSFLAGKVGTECMGSEISLFDDPFARGLGSTDWDAEGMPARRIDFVRGGILQCFAYDLKTAYRFQENSTASAVRSGFGGSPSIGVHNLILEGERWDIFDERALYIHDIVGAHTANPLSGDFSVELSNAYWVEENTPQEPVRHAMFAGNVFDLLRSVIGLGRESRVVGPLILPPIRFHSQRIIGK